MSQTLRAWSRPALLGPPRGRTRPPPSPWSWLCSLSVEGQLLASGSHEEAPGRGRPGATHAHTCPRYTLGGGQCTRPPPVRPPLRPHATPRRQRRCPGRMQRPRRRGRRLSGGAQLETAPLTPPHPGALCARVAFAAPDSETSQRHRLAAPDTTQTPIDRGGDKQGVCIHTAAFYRSASHGEETLTRAAAWMSPEDITIEETSQSRRGRGPRGSAHAGGPQESGSQRRNAERRLRKAAGSRAGGEWSMGTELPSGKAGRFWRRGAVTVARPRERALKWRRRRVSCRVCAAAHTDRNDVPTHAAPRIDLENTAVTWKKPDTSGHMERDPIHTRISRTGKPTEAQSGSAVAEAWEEAEWGRQLTGEAAFWGGENALELDGGGHGCTAQRTS